MADQPTPPPKPPWRQEPAPPPEPGRRSPAARRGIFVLVAGLLALGATFIGLLFWVRPSPNPAVVPLWVTQYRARAVPTPPQALPDRDGLRSAELFARWPASAPPGEERHVLVRELNSLAQLSQQDPVVVYLSAHAVRDAAGAILVLPADLEPDSAQTALPLRQVLEALRQCPAPRHLLVLDLFRPLADARLGILVDDVAAGIEAELNAVPDERRLVLCSCAPGQESLASEDANRTVFGFYFEEGVRGWADGALDGAKDGHVSARELAEFLRARVDRWAVVNRGARQTPVLHGAGDFLLRTLPETAPTGHVAETATPKYPKSLLAAWQAHDRLLKEGAYRLAPHEFRQAQALLLRAERSWRSGLDLATIEADDLAEYDRQRAEIARLQSLPHPEPQSLALAAALGGTDDPEADKMAKQILAKLRDQPPAARPKEAEAERAKLAREFRDKFEGQPAYARARPVFDLALSETDVSPERFQLLDAMLRSREELLPRFVETLALRRVAELPGQLGKTAWPADTVRRLLAVTRRGEEAAADARAFRWNATLLEQAAQLRHEGEVLVWARGFAALDDADTLLRQAADAYQTALTRGGILRAARDAVDDALTFLPAYVPYLEAAPANLGPWEQALQVARELHGLLYPDAGPPSAPIPTIQDKTGILTSLLGSLREPFALARLAQLERRSRLPRPEPAVVGEIDAVLATPFVPAEARSSLWLAGRELQRRLHRRATDLDRDDERAEVPTAAQPDFDRQAADLQERQRADRRAQSALALLDAAGLPSENLTRLREQLAKARRDAKSLDGWRALGEKVRVAWAKQLPGYFDEPRPLPQLDRLARLMPPFDRARALAERQRTPAAQMLQQDRAALWDWLADRYRYQAREYRAARLDDGFTTGERFFDQAARAYRNEGAPQTHVEMSGPTLPRLTTLQPTATYPLDVRTVGPRPVTPLTLRPLLADALWLKVEPLSAPLPKGAGVVPLRVEMKETTETANVPPPQGFLVQARADSRSFHHKVEVALSAADDRPRLLLSADPRLPELPLSEIRLRPGKVRQPLYLYVRNPGDDPRKVVVELQAPDALDGLLRAEMAVPPRDTLRVSFGQPIPKLPDDLPELSGPLTLRLLDGERRTEVLDERTYRVAVAHPREYVRVSDVKFTPGSKANQFNHTLAVSLVALSPPEGPDIPVELVLPADRIPGLTAARDGVFRGKLPTKRAEKPAVLNLFAEKLGLAEGADEEGYVYLNVDGYDRAFILRTTFARRGDPTTPRGDVRPAVRLGGADYVKSGTDAKAVLEVDNAPDSAVVEFAVGKFTGAEFLPQLPPQKLPSGRKRRVGFTPLGPGGALLFEATVKDWALPLDTAKVLGRRDLRARLLDGAGKELAVALDAVTVAESAPERVRFLDVPPKVMKGTTPLLKAVGTDSTAGIDKVLFFVGKPAEGKLPPNVTPVPGEALDGRRTEWAAKVPLPADKTGPTEVSVQFVNRAGMSSFATTTLELTDTDPAKTGPGKIRGRVLLGSLPQPGLDVVLQDEKGAVKGNAKTKADGTFVFAGVAPGNYRVWSFKPEGQRRGFAPAVVEPNKEINVTVSLALPGVSHLPRWDEGIPPLRIVLLAPRRYPGMG